MASDNVLLAAQDPARLTVGEEILNIELQPDNDDSDVMIHVHPSPICLIIRSATLRRSTLWCHCHPFRQCQPTHPPTSHTPSFPHTNTYTLSLTNSPPVWCLCNSTNTRRHPVRHQILHHPPTLPHAHPHTQGITSLCHIAKHAAPRLSHPKTALSSTQKLRYQADVSTHLAPQ